jgi:hypothetical protein
MDLVLDFVARDGRGMEEGTTVIAVGLSDSRSPRR